MSLLCFFLFFKSLPEGTFIDFRGRGVRGKRDRNVDVRNIDQLPPVCALTGDRTCNLGMSPD